MYYLNNKEIDFEKIVDLHLNESKKNRFFLNIKTGKVNKNLKRGTWSEDFYEIPRITQSAKYILIEEFIDEGFFEENPELFNEAQILIKKGEYDKLEDVLKKDKNYKFFTWKDWARMPTADFIFNWLDNLPVEFREEWEYDCDCPLCMEMQKAEKEGREMSFSETIDAFKKADKLYPQRTYINPKLIEEKLEEIIKDKKITLAEIKEKIYEEGTNNESPMEASQKYNDWWISKMQLDPSADNFSEILDAFTDAWNHFPHKSLGGKSPREITE